MPLFGEGELVRGRRAGEQKTNPSATLSFESEPEGSSLRVEDGTGGRKRGVGENEQMKGLPGLGCLVNIAKNMTPE